MRSGLKLLVVSSVSMCVGLLTGCGAWQYSLYSVPPGAPVNIDGNWLISGSLPSISSAGPPTGGLNFSASLSVSNGQLTGAGAFNAPCGGLSGVFGFAISGSLGSSGTFTAQASISNPGVSLTFNGTPPSQSDGAWTGTYTYINPGCPQPLTGKFTSTPLGDLTGTYTGSTSLSPGYGSGTPVSITVQLKQGGNVTLPGGGTGYSAYALSGSLSVTGTSCFHSGTLTNSTGAEVEVAGNYVALAFTMDDGSELSLGGTFTDLAANTISISNGRVSPSGACSLESLGTLTLQR